MKMIYSIWCSAEITLQTLKVWLLGFIILISTTSFTGATDLDIATDLSPERVYVTTDRDFYISGESILFNVYLFPADESPERTSRFVYLMFRSSYGSIERFTLKVNEKKQASGVIYVPDTLSSGAYEIIAFTNYMRNWGEDIFFTKELLVANRFDNKLEVFEFEPEEFSQVTDSNGVVIQESLWDNEISAINPVRITSPEIAGRRQKVSVSIENNDTNEKNLKTLDLNVSVFPVRFNQHQNHTYTQRLEKPLQYTGKFPMEDQQVLLTGKLADKQSGKPVPGARVLMNTPDTVITLAYSITKENGEFSFFLLPYYYNRDIYLSVDPSSWSGDFNIIINDRFELSQKFRAPEKVKLRISPEEIKRYQDIIRVQKIYQLDNFKPGKDQYVDKGVRPLLYSKPKFSVLPSLYVELDDFREIARELISPLSVRRSQGNYSARMFCTRSSAFLQGSPVFFVDGIITWDLNPLITLGSEHIREVQVHNMSWVFGNMLFPGIVGIFTYSEEYRSIGLNRNKAHYYFDSYKTHPVFTPPVYESGPQKDQNSPDVRLLIYWNNDVQLDYGGKAEVKFYTGDLPGNYLISVSGLDQDGEFFREKQLITIH
ncbi:MAG: carboxypeptidase-like regulatory domain-containing protein [Bacteroidales bacterium]|nr:carboxypeptidase-like regulatory domain-containing protein [Bacteroidales bacterium]